MDILRFSALGLLAGAAIGAIAGDLEIPDFGPSKSSASLGDGSASFSAKSGLISISADVSSMGDYAENWKMKAALFDHTSPKGSSKSEKWLPKNGGK